jgi:penicillin-binding protein 2A
MKKLGAFILKKIIIKKKYIFLSASLAIVSLLIYMTIESMSIYKDLEMQKHTILTDRHGESIYTEKRIKSDKEIPEMISIYIEKEKLVNQIPAMMYPSNYSKQVFTKLLTKTLFSKEELKTFYINNVYFDYGLVGMPAASHYFFNKELIETTPSQQMMLLSFVTLEKSENLLSDRQGFFTQLVEEGYVSQEEVNQTEPLLAVLNTTKQSYAQQALLDSEKALGVDRNELIRTGYKIHTHLDPTVQAKMYKQFQEDTNFPSGGEGGMVVLDKKSGEVLGLMGGRNYQNSSLNRASQIKRQPASAFKPLMVFAPAIDLGWKPDQLLKDSPMKVGGYQPVNRDYQYRGEVSLTEGFIQSYNVPTVWLLYKIGIKTGLHYIDQFDLFDIDPKDGYKLALGFSSKGSTPLALAQAYSIFPNEGNMVEAQVIERIMDPNGKKIFENTVEQKRVIKKETAEVMDTLLRKVITDGTGFRANIEGEFIAGKTGTTSYDGWFVGYTDDYLAAVWTGLDKVDPNHKLKAEDGGFPSILFKNVMMDVIKN